MAHIRELMENGPRFQQLTLAFQDAVKRLDFPACWRAYPTGQG